MTYSTGAEINVIIRNNDLLRGVIHFGKSSELPLICLVLSNRIGDLNIILFIPFIRYEVNFLRTIMVYLKIIAHVNKFIINNIFKIMGQIIPVIHDPDRIQSHIFIIDLKIVFKFTFGFGRVFFHSLY